MLLDISVSDLAIPPTPSLARGSMAHAGHHALKLEGVRSGEGLKMNSARVLSMPACCRGPAGIRG